MKWYKEKMLVVTVVALFIMGITFSIANTYFDDHFNYAPLVIFWSIALLTIIISYATRKNN